jgi:hypothetical protein
MRALDYLSSLPEVDASRLGVLGVSGGGFGAVLLAALDPRVAAVAPVVMISASFDGGDIDEIGMPIREPSGTNNTEIAALVAPRPQLFVSNGRDWTHDFPVADFQYLRAVYGLYGAVTAVESAHLPKEGHDLGPNKRLEVYDFFAGRFGLQRLPLGGGELPEGIEPEPQDRLRVFDAEHPRPGFAVTDPEAASRLLYGASPGQ